MAVMAGDVTPPRPEANSRANEGVSCEVCHSIKGIGSDPPFNFSYLSSPGASNTAPNQGCNQRITTPKRWISTESRIHAATVTMKKIPSALVKSTQLEWKEGPYAKEGVPCLQCHMPKPWYKRHYGPGGYGGPAPLPWRARQRKIASAIELRMQS
jgi:hypothetical protein